MDRRHCLSDQELASLYSESPASTEVLAHVRACAGCRQRFERQRSQVETITTPALATTTQAVIADAPPPARPEGPRSPGNDSQPSRIGKYLVLGILDEGGQGTVYRAVHPALGKELVIKLAKRPIRGGPADRAGLVAEGRLLAELDQPDLVRVYDLDFHDERPFLVMEYVPGRSLRQVNDERRPPPRQAAALVARVARALGAAHRRGIVHQDIKPQNILIDQEGRPRLIDFGMARMRHAWGDDLEPSGGTPAYMAPEQARGEIERMGPRSDIFALGAVLYDLLVGSPPFAARDFRKALDRAARCDFDRAALSRGGEVPRHLARICLRAMAASPDDRFGTADELADQLESYVRLPRRTAVLSVVVASLVIGLIGGGWWLSRPDVAVRRAEPRPASVASEISSSLASQSELVPDPGTTPPLRVLSLVVRRFQFDTATQRSEIFGAIGDAQFEAKLGDEVRVEAELSAPAYCYLVAFNPDGQRQLCYPPNLAGKADETVRPSPTRTLRYPKRETSYFRLSDGRGQQVFVLFASRTPLPPFAEWRPRLGEAPWIPVRQAGVWTFDGGEVRPVVSAAGGRRGQEVEHVPGPFEALGGFLKEKAGVDLLHAIAFPVE